MNPKTAVLGAGVLLSLALLLIPVFFSGNRRSGEPRDLADAANQKPLSSPTGSGSLSDSMTASLPTILLQALALKDPSDRHEFLKKWAESIDTSTMEKLLEKLQTMPVDASLRAEANAALLTSWGKRDVTGATTWFGKRQAADGLHQQARDLLGQNMARQNPSDMVQWMETNLPETSRNELYGPFFREWAKRDPESAAELVEEMTGNTEGAAGLKWIDLTGQVAALWASTDLSRAVDWVESLPEGAAKAQALGQISYKWAESNPQAAAAYAAQENNPQFISNVVNRWAESDVQAAAAWARTLPNNESGVAAATSLASAWAANDPVAAATYVAGLPSGDAQNKAAAAVVAAWASTDPAQAAQWVTQFDEGTVRQLAITQLMNSWTEVDPAQAAQWLQTLPDSSSRDSAINAFITAVSPTDPGTAFQWTENISDQIMRNNQFQNIAQTWLRQDPAAARQAITQSSMPGFMKFKLLSPDGK